MSETTFIKILLAEDNNVSRELMAGILRNRNFKILMAVDGGSAIRVLEENDDIDLAIVDQMMAPRGGFEFVKFARNNGYNLPILMVTADESTDLLSEATRHGVNRVLQKPVDPDRLLESVERMLRQIGYNPTPIAVQSHNVHLNPEALMGRAVELAEKNARSGRGGPFGAVVADKEGKIIGEGVNGITSRIDPTAHAEIMAIRQAAEYLNATDLQDCTLYSSSEPTMMGKALIISVGIKKVYYGLSHGDIAAIRETEQKVRDDFASSESCVEFAQIGYDNALEMYSHWKSGARKVID